MSSDQNKNPATLPGAEPDVIVVVGGKEFQEYSYVLRSWSGYFDGYFRHPEMEQSGRFEFPDRDPEEWLLIKELTNPFSDTTINKDNVSIAVSWFDELCCVEGLKKCDKYMSTVLIPSLISEEEFKKNSLDFVARAVVGELDESDVYDAEPLMDASALAIKGNLEQSMQLSLTTIQRLLKESPLFLAEHVESLISMMQENKNYRDKLWPELTRYLEPYIADDFDEPNLLLAKELLPHMFKIGIHAQWMREAWEQFSGQLVDLIADHGSPDNPIVKALLKDKKIGRIFQQCLDELD